MNYEQFKTMLCPAILCREEVVGRHVCIEHVKEDVLCIWDEEDLNQKISLQTQDLYELYLSRNMCSVVDEIVCRLRLVQFFEAYSPIIRPMNYEMNQELLQDTIYQKIDDITLALYTVMYDNNGCLAAEKICRSAAQIWGVSAEKLLEETIISAGRIRPPRLYHRDDIERMSCLEGGVFMPGERGKRIEIHNHDAEEGIRGYRLTVQGYTNGASALFYPGVQERLATLLEGDYYVGFISVNEVVIHPARNKVLGEMRQAVRRANVMRPEKERLTEHIYRYCSNGKGLVQV